MRIAALLPCALALALGPVQPVLAADFPVTVESCDRQVRFDAPPERAIVTHSNLIEMMLALGLEDHIAGVTDASERLAASAEMFPAAEGLKTVQAQGLSLELLLDHETDFLFSGWSYGLRVGGEITPQSLAAYDIPVYELSESCIRLGQKTPASFDYLYRDLTNLAAIFGAPKRATVLLDDYCSRLAHIADDVAKRGGPPPRVFVYDSGDRVAVSAGKYAMPQAIITAAGGKNILEDIESSWVRVDWETVIDRNPEAVVIVDYGAVSAEEKIQFLRENPAFAHVPAIRDNRFLVLTYDEMTPGTRNVGATERLAAFLAGQ